MGSSFVRPAPKDISHLYRPSLLKTFGVGIAVTLTATVTAVAALHFLHVSIPKNLPMEVGVSAFGGAYCTMLYYLKSIDDKQEFRELIHHVPKSSDLSSQKDKHIPSCVL